MAAKLLSALLHSRTQSHIYHWRTQSFAAHKALQGYYEAIVPLFDDYAEGYQGRYGLISGYTSAPVNQNPMKARAYFQRLLKIVDATKIKDSYLKNILDTIRQLVYQTLYLLTLDRPSVSANRVSANRVSATHSNKTPSSTPVRQNRPKPTNRNK
jgi:DNA-binding ferritin-like protein